MLEGFSAVDRNTTPVVTLSNAIFFCGGQLVPAQIMDYPGTMCRWHRQDKSIEPEANQPDSNSIQDQPKGFWFPRVTFCGYVRANYFAPRYFGSRRMIFPLAYPKQQQSQPD
jgi:hypothetical protein